MVGITHHHWVGSITKKAGLTLVPILVWLVNIQPPWHAVIGVPEQICTVGIQFTVVSLKDLVYRDFLELKPFFVVVRQLRGHET